ncbi:putative endonuclease containing a URI domain [Galbibacter orientalis DSM 19592]|uniref:Putative endonuclease containing a URI domain n=1 Tax=Galbibacter orientalis DSM 19592 TaxID=926559 RepID=I3C2L1_9FLAO|nr:GIY-YIG nuclease family protein [Galbibacter orientalis]EIJ37854.1 putative endonuclease containing a URI domain [Galbibacter orientalis DSM 19592]
MLECLPAVGRAELVDLSADRQARFKLLTMITVYAISSLKTNYIYVGMTSNLKERINRHNSGRERTTKFYLPFELIFSEVCNDRKEGRIKEKYWKSGIGKEKLKALRDSTK